MLRILMSDERYGRNGLFIDKEDGRESPDYVHECTGRNRRCLSHGMIPNSDTPTS